jgi:hypothetical protein
MANANVADPSSSKDPSSSSGDDTPESVVDVSVQVDEIDVMIMASEEIIRCLDEARPRFEDGDLLDLIDTMRGQFRTFINCARRGAVSDERTYRSLALLYERVTRHLCRALNAQYPAEAIDPFVKALGTTRIVADILGTELTATCRREAAARRAPLVKPGR